MSRPPTPTQRTYRGRIRADMRSAYRHLNKVNNWEIHYVTGPSTKYPNQLYSDDDAAIISTALSTLNRLLASKGPIPSRV